MREKRIFTKEEINYIIDNWGKESAYSMRKKFKCSFEAVCKVATENGLEKPKSNQWTEEEIEYLQDNFKTSTYEEISKKLGRTTKAVGYKAESLGFQKVIKKSTN